MDLYFASAEQPPYLRQLVDLGIKHVAISFYEWQRRHSTDDLYKHIPSDVSVLVTPGVAKKEAIDFEEFGKNYLEFCERNADQCIIYDLDAPACPLNIRLQVRNQLSLFPNLVAFPVDQDELEGLTKEHERIGINARMNKSMAPNELRRIQGALYGSNVTDPRSLRLARFEATTTMAWLSGRRYGELWIFARNKLHHYSGENLVKAVRVHRDDIEFFGVDSKACAANDRDALTEIAVRSLQAMAESLSQRPRDRNRAEVADASDNGAGGNVAGHGSLVPSALPLGNGALAIEERETTPLPNVVMKTQDDVQIVTSANGSMRKCDTCFLSDSCPEYKEHNSCAYSLPVEIKTVAQRKAAANVLLEIQFKRTTFAAMAEEAEGNGTSPAVGREMDRFFKLNQINKELDTPIPGGGMIGKYFQNLPGSPDGQEGADEEDDDYEDAEGVETEYDPSTGDFVGVASSGQEHEEGGGAEAD